MANQLDELNPEVREEGVDTNVITLITKDSCMELPLQSKESAANAILDQALLLKL